MQSPGDIAQQDRIDFLGCIILTASFLTISIMVTFPLFDYDTFWHVANGREMFSRGTIVTTELFSYTADPTKSFHNHEWLSQILMFLFFDTWGTSGLLVFKAILTTLICSLLYLTIRTQGGSREVALILCIAAVYMGINRYEVRPQLFSFLGVVSLAYILYGYRSGRFRQGVLAWLPIIFTLWNCLHGPVYGLGFLGMFIVGESTKFVLSQRISSFSTVAVSSRQLKFLWGWTIITFFCLLINPEGLLTYSYFVNLFSGSSKMLMTTAEFTPTPLTLEFLPFWFFTLIPPLSFALKWKRLDITNLLLATAFLYLALRFQRAVPVFGLVAMPILVANLQESALLRSIKNSRVPLIALLLCMVAVYLGKFTGRSNYFSFGTGINGKILPVGSTRFIKEANLTGNMFNSDRYGGYLAYWVAPERKIFHYNIPDLFEAAQSYFHRADTIINQWNINYAIVGYKPELDMFRREGFVPVFWEAPAAVLLKDIPLNKKIIDTYQIRYFRPLLNREQLLNLANTPGVFPVLAQEIGNYLSFVSNKEMADLLGELLARPNKRLSAKERIIILSKAERYNQQSAILLQSAGILHYLQHNLALAEEKLSNALKINDKLVPASLNIAYLYYDQGNYQSAIIQFTKTLRLDRNNVNALYGLALSQYKLADYSSARQSWNRYLELAPNSQWADKARTFLSKMAKLGQ